MKKYFVLLTIAFFLIGTLLIITWKSTKPFSKMKSTKKIGVAVSIIPLAEFVEKVGGDKVKVTVMIPPGASPHTYEPKPSQLKEVEKAALYVKVGTPIEFELAWMDKLLSFNQKMLLVDASKGIKLIKKETIKQTEKQLHQGIDPHIWLSPVNAEIIVENIYQGLIKIDPENKKYYKNNKDNYIKELKELNKEISEVTYKFKGRKFMVFHPAWGYFAKDYNLLQIPIEIEGKEPSPKDLANLIKQAKKENIKVIFAAPEFNTETAKLISREINGKIILISSLEKNYISNIRKIVKALKEN